MGIGRMVVWAAAAISFLFLGVPANADDRAFNIPIQQGQGVSGNIKLHVSRSAGDDLVVTVDAATITYMPKAGFNGLDGTSGNLEIQGLLLVPQLGGDSTGAETRVLVPFVNLQKRGTTYSCTACGEGVVLKETLAGSDTVIPALVVSNLIMFMPQENLAVGVAEPETKPSTDVATESSSQRLARIARAANLPIASLPNLQSLQAEDYSLLQSALDGIADETGLDAGVKSVLASAVTQAANMAFSPILEKFVFEKFGLQSQIILKGIVANPVAYASEAGNSASVDLLKGIAIGIAGGMAADAIFSLKPLSDLPPKWKEPMRAMTKATVVETINLGTSAVDPSVAAAGIANRLYEFYQIYKASVALADTQNEAIVAAAIGLETAARLVILNPSEKNNEIARSTIASTVTNLNEAFGDGYSIAMAEIVNLTFVGLLSEFRGDTDRAAQMVAHIREKGKLGADDALPDVLARPINWIASFATWSGDPPSRVAALMISSTVLNNLEQGELAAPDVTDPAIPSVAVEAAPQPETTANGDIWGPDIVPPNGFDIGSIDWSVDCSKNDARKCLSERGLSPAAVDFNLAAFPDAPDGGIATEFRELGVVDWVNLSVIYSPYEATLLANGKPDIINPELTRDIAAAFSDSASGSMLRRFPQATAIGGRIAGYRALPNGQQRFVFVETVFDGCHACDVLGAAVTFLDFSTNGTLTVRQPIGLNLGEPGQDEELTADVLLKDPQALQTALNIRGYDAGSMDGVLGNKSRQALSDFQQEQCLSVTGELDLATANSLIFSDPLAAASCTGSNAPTKVGSAISSPISDGTYINTSAFGGVPGLCAEATITDEAALRVIDGKLNFYESSCQVLGNSPTSQAGYVTLFLQCSGEGQQWEMEKLFQVTSENTFELGGEHYQGCLGSEWVATGDVIAPKADLRTFCQSNPNDPGPGEDATDDPEVLAAGANTWRCMAGEVLVCDLGASGRACLQTSQPTAQARAELSEFCRTNLSNDYIPNYLTQGLADEWRCEGSNAVAVNRASVDTMGYFVEAWRPLDSAGIQPDAVEAANDTTTASPSPAEGPSNDDIEKAIVGNAVIRQHIARISISISDCIPQEEINRPGFRGPFWACSFSVTEAVFKNPAATGWDEWAMLTGSAETRFVQGIRTGVTEWTQRFGQAKNGSWGVQFIFR